MIEDQHSPNYDSDHGEQSGATSTRVHSILWTTFGASVILGGIVGAVIGCIDVSVRGNDSTQNFYLLVVIYGFMYGALAGLISAMGGMLAAYTSYRIRKRLSRSAVVVVGLGAAVFSTAGWFALIEVTNLASSAEVAVPGIIIGTATTCVGFLLSYWAVTRRGRLTSR